MSVKLIYEDVAVGADKDASLTTVDAQAESDIASLPFGTEFPALISLEPNQWRLNGTRRETLRGKTVGLLSKKRSGANGRFTTPLTLNISFTEKHTSLGLFLRFDLTTGAYCDDVAVRWYQGNTLLAQGTFYPDGAEYFCQKTVTAYNRIVLQFNATALPGRYLRLTKILFGISRTFLLNELRDVKIIEELDPISTEVSINTMDFTLDSENDVDYMFQRKQPIYAYDGDTLIGTFYVSESAQTGKGLYDVSCVDAIGVLDEEKIPAKIYNKVPIRAALEEIFGGYFELDLDPELEGEALTGYIPNVTRREAAQQVAIAARAVIDTSGTSKIKVFRLGGEAVETIPEGRIYEGSTVSTAAIVTAVKVTAHAYSTTGSGESVEVDGVKYYHTQTVTTIVNPNVTATDKQNVIEVTEATLVNPQNVGQVAQFIYDHYMKRNTMSLRIVLAGESPGKSIRAVTPWGKPLEGTITRMDITPSGVSAADCEVIGAS